MILLTLGFLGIIIINSTPGNCRASLIQYIAEGADIGYSNAEEYVSSQMQCICLDPLYFKQNISQITSGNYLDEETLPLRTALDAELIKIEKGDTGTCPNTI